MATLNVPELLESMTRDVKAVNSYAETELTGLSEEVLNWKPTPKQWSIQECLAHLNIFSRHYLPLHAKGMAKSNKPASQTLSPGFLGEKLTRSMKPLPDGTIPSPMATLKMFDPTRPKNQNPQALDEFLKHQQTLLQQLQQAKDHNLNSIRITSTLGPIIRFKLGDSFRFVIAHEERHILQIKKVLKQYKAKG